MPPAVRLRGVDTSRRRIDKPALGWYHGLYPRKRPISGLHEGSTGGYGGNTNFRGGHVTQTNPKGARGEIRNKGIAERHRARRREEAEARQAERANRSDMDQVALLEKRPGNSKREKARLKSKRKGR